MAEKNRGWIKLHRQLTESEIWDSDDPFEYRSAWIDLLLMVNHEERTVTIRGTHQRIIVQAGQTLKSNRKLAERWNWSVNRVRRYLEHLESMGMCTVETKPYGTLISVINWGIYQQDLGGSANTNEHSNGYSAGYSNGYTGEYSTGTVTNTPANTATNNEQECKEYKNEKNELENVKKNKMARLIPVGGRVYED